MLKNLWTLALLALLITSVAFADDDSDDDSDSDSSDSGSGTRSFEDDANNCEDLCDGSENNDGDCELYQGFKNISIEVTFTSSQKTIFETWLEMIKTTILSSTTFTYLEKIYKVSASLQLFQTENLEIYNLFKYSNLSTWSVVSDLVKVTITRQQSTCESAFTLDDDDNCPLFDALLNGTQGNFDQEEAVKGFINGTLIDICGNSSMSTSEKTIAIYQAFVEFFAIHAEYQFSFFQFEIVGLGSLQQLWEIGLTNYQLTEVTTVVSGSVSECKVLQSIQFALQSTEISVAVKATLKQYYDVLVQYFETQTSVVARLKFLSETTRQFGKFNFASLKYIFDISIEGFGCIFDLIYCSSYHRSGKTTVSALPASTMSQCSCTCGVTGVTGITV